MLIGLIYKVFKGDVGTLCLFICKTYNEPFTTFHVAFFMFMKKHANQQSSSVDGEVPYRIKTELRVVTQNPQISV